MSEEIVVYTQPGCPPCDAAKKFLTEKGVAFTAKNIHEDPDAINELIALGSQSTPTIKMGDKVMIGFRKNELAEWIGAA